MYAEIFGYNSEIPMLNYSQILHNFIVPAALGLILTGLKVMAARRELSFDEFNGIALDLILVAIGASAINLIGKPVDAIISFGVGAAGLATALLLIQYHRSGKAAKLKPGERLKETSRSFAIFQLMLGVAAFIWLFEAS